MELYQFLVGRDGKVVQRYAPTDTPQSPARDIEAVLNAQRSARVCARVVHTCRCKWILARGGRHPQQPTVAQNPGSCPEGPEGVGLNIIPALQTFRTHWEEMLVFMPES